jgi:hypothetical protein
VTDLDASTSTDVIPTRIGTNIISICFSCARYRSGATCEAFPTGIPDELIYGLADHRTPVPGDGGITHLLHDSDQARSALDFYERWNRILADAASVASVASVAKHLGPRHDQKTHGRRGASSANIARTFRDGGFTYSMIARRFRTTGKVVSPYEDLSREVSAEEYRTNGVEIIKEFMEANAEMLANPDHHLGAWRDIDDDGNEVVWLDVTIVVDSSSNAAKIGKQHNQKAYWDLDKNREVPLGGTGKSTTGTTGETTDETSVSKAWIDNAFARLAATGTGLRPGGAPEHRRSDRGVRPSNTRRMIDTIFKHLGSQHDQKTHGRRSVSGHRTTDDLTRQRGIDEAAEALEGFTPDWAGTYDAREAWSATFGNVDAIQQAALNIWGTENAAPLSDSDVPPAKDKTAASTSDRYIDDTTAHQMAANMITGLRDVEPVTETLYRGMAVSTEMLDAVVGGGEGSTVDLNLSSFTWSNTLATDFQRSFDATLTPVMIATTGPVKALKVDELEVISAGQFRIERVTWVENPNSIEDPIMYVEMSQQAVFDA